MTIIAARIDGRLIHGQVANLWTTKLNISRIIVVDDEIVDSILEKTALKLATEKAANNILAGKYDSQRLMIVARKPDRFLGLIERGVVIPELNVGNMSQSSETRSVTRSINVVSDDIKDFDAINAKGTKLIAQMVPGDTPVDFLSLLEKVR